MAIAARAYTSTSNLGWGFDAFGLALDVGFDVVEVSRATEGVKIHVIGLGSDDIPADSAKNTAGVALQALLECYSIKSGLAAIVRKGIRHGSGMGSSAASAAAAVFAANALLSLNMTAEQMVDTAAEGERASAGAAHADNVAPALLGGFTIVEKGPPSAITRLTPPDSLRMVMVTPSIHVPTSVARQRLPKDVSLATYAQGAARSGAIVAALLTGDVAALGRSVEGSFVDAARAPLIPGFDAVRAAARNAGAAGVFISGAGPTIAAIVASNADANAIARAMQAAFRDAGLQSEAHVARPAPGAALVEASA